MRKLNRLPPKLAPSQMQTYQILAPKDTHWRVATCEEVECLMSKNGWVMKLDLGTELGQRQAHYIKYQSGRKFSHTNLGDGLVELTFASGQPCFKEHRVRTDAPEKFIVKGGDFRGNPRGFTRVHTKPEHWVEDFAENQDRLARRIEKG